MAPRSVDIVHDASLRLRVLGVTSRDQGQRHLPPSVRHLAARYEALATQLSATDATKDAAGPEQAR